MVKRKTAPEGGPRNRQSGPPPHERIIPKSMPEKYSSPLERFIARVEEVRRSVCDYGPDAERCDCKFYTPASGSPSFRKFGFGTEVTGCPELRVLIGLMKDSALGGKPLADLWWSGRISHEPDWRARAIAAEGEAGSLRQALDQTRAVLARIYSPEDPDGGANV